MKTLKTLTFAAASLLALVGSSAHADTLVHIAGSTAYRSAVHNAIVHLMTAGGGTCAVAYAGSNLAGANQAVFQGTVSTDPSLGTLTVETSWTGSLTGIAGLTRGDTFTFLKPAAITTGTATASTQSGFSTNFGITAGPQATGGQVSSSTLASGATNTETVATNYALSDAYQNSTLFSSARGFTLLTDNIVGVIPFTWLKSAAQTTDTDYTNGGFGRLTNISALQAKYLFAGGYALASGFTGNTSDTYFVNLMGRDYDSGTRFDAINEAQLPGSSTITQFGNGAGSASTGSIIAQGGGTVSAPSSEVSQTSGANSQSSSYEQTSFPANGGFNSGGSLDKAMEGYGYDSAPDFGGYCVAYSGASDADGVLGNTSGGPSGYVPVSTLTYNGVALTKANVNNGTYSFWTYEHFLTIGSPTGFALDLIPQLKNTDATVAGYTLTSMGTVSRTVEGGVISLQQ